jgi:hypothetical protein
MPVELAQRSRGIGEGIAVEDQPDDSEYQRSQTQSEPQVVVTPFGEPSSYRALKCLGSRQIQRDE